MSKGLEALASMDYPGRFIALGQNKEGNNVVVYGLTGRSDPSKARKLVRATDSKIGSVIKIEVTDPEQLKKGDYSLLVYPAIAFGSGDYGITVSNGSQTIPLTKQLNLRQNYLTSFVYVSHHWEHEPDAPNFTPRISGFMPKDKRVNPILGIIKRSPGGSSERSYFEIPRIEGKGRLISTYSGVNTNPLPSFNSTSLPIEFNEYTPEGIAHSFYDALNSNFRIAVAAVVVENNNNLKHIINEIDVKKK